ncbi:hypothetical protein B0T24DRAFT_683533 [Lasiosphaeria ovina]|uniref:Uncharacterized protein n=1 Tax=Lasiosphaeria ovina TaxID=92902 RepID=A0AAE0JWA1_9PEZI|nr:hypothetical protein B0T24DRAFT_683533 [Lasiosphaeria ovina]
MNWTCGRIGTVMCRRYIPEEGPRAQGSRNDLLRSISAPIHAAYAGKRKRMTEEGTPTNAIRDSNTGAAACAAGGAAPAELRGHVVRQRRVRSRKSVEEIRNAATSRPSQV